MDQARRLLERMLHVGDEVADELAAGIARRHDALEAARILTNLVRFRFESGLPLDPEVEHSLTAFEAHSESLPAWRGDASIRNGKDFFQDHAILGFVVLGCASLPHCYSWRTEARVLGLTQGMGAQVARRVPETAQFVLDVLGDRTLSGSDPEGPRSADGRSGTAGSVPVGIRAIQKVRLMHALMRLLISEDPARLANLAEVDGSPTFCTPLLRCQWPRGEGVPISQTFLAGTLLSFSWVVLRALRRMWVPVADAQAADYLHVWRIIGHNLGVQPELLEYFRTYEGAGELHEAMMADHRGATEDGLRLSAALENYVQQSIVGRTPFHRVLGLRHLPRVVTWHLCEVETVRAIGMVPSRGQRVCGFAIWPLLRLFGLMKHWELMQGASNLVFRWLAGAMWDWRVGVEPGAGVAQPSLGEAETNAARRPRISALVADRLGLPHDG